MKQLLHYPITHLPFYIFCKIKTILTDFIRCGIAGWCLEITFTSLHALQRREHTLKGSTSIWMFPIYGSIAFLKPLFLCMRHLHVVLRGTIYAALIFCGEYISGRFLSAKKICPWNYKNSKWHIHEVIRLDFFPYWFLTGFLFEMLLTRHDR